MSLASSPTLTQRHPTLGLSRHLLLDLETRLRESWWTLLRVAKKVEPETPYVHTFTILSPFRLNRETERFSPWQIIVSTLTTIYALKNLDKILGLGCKFHPSFS